MQTLNRDPDAPAYDQSIIYHKQACNLASQSPVQAFHCMEGLLTLHILWRRAAWLQEPVSPTSFIDE